MVFINGGGEQHGAVDISYTPHTHINAGEIRKEKKRFIFLNFRLQITKGFFSDFKTGREETQQYTRNRSRLGDRERENRRENRQHPVSLKNSKH